MQNAKLFFLVVTYLSAKIKIFADNTATLENNFRAFSR